LRDRREDIEPLSEFFLQKHLPSTGKKFAGFERSTGRPQAIQFSRQRKELENIVERAVILEKGPLITPTSLHLPQDLSD